jgi:hypothetical protein
VLYSKDSANMLTVFLLSIKASENAEVSTHCWPTRICSGQRKQSAQIKIRWRDQDVRPGTQLKGKAKIGKAKIIPLQVELTDDIDEVKSKIEELDKETPALNQCLFLGDVELEGSKMLADYHIKTGSCIDIEKKLFGMKWVDVGTQVPSFFTDITQYQTLGLKWLHVVGTEPVSGHNLDHASYQELAAALSRQVRSLACQALPDVGKIELTKQEWEAFGIKDLRTNHFIKSGDSYFQPVGSKEYSKEYKLAELLNKKLVDNNKLAELLKGMATVRNTEIVDDNRFIDLAYDESVMILKNAFGLKWIQIEKPKGQELKNELLAKGLASKLKGNFGSTVTFEPEEWIKYNAVLNDQDTQACSFISGRAPPEIKELRLTHFVKADVNKGGRHSFRHAEGARYFKPAEEEWLSQNHCIKAANGRYYDIIT